MDLPCPLQSVCQRHAQTLTPRRVGHLRGRYGRHSHVAHARAARQVPAIIFIHLERWLTERRIAINVSKSSAIIFARAGRRFIQSRSMILFGEPINWVDTIRYLGLALDKRLTCSPHIEQVSRRTAQRMGLLGPLLNRRSDLSIMNGVLLYKQLIRPLMDYACPAWKSADRTDVRRLQVLHSKCLRLVTGAPGTLVTGRFTRIWAFLFSPTTSEP